jgi:hypothetical protein
VAYTNALMETGEIPEIQSQRDGKPAGGVKKEVAVSKRGSLIIPKDWLKSWVLKWGICSWQVRPGRESL